MEFIEACENGDLEEAKYLVAHGADYNDLDDHAFKMACMNGHLHIVQWLCTLEGVDIHSMYYDRCDNEYNAFIFACTGNHLNIVEWLLSFDPTMNKYFEQAILMSCSHGQLEMVKWLYANSNRHLNIDYKWYLKWMCQESDDYVDPKENVDVIKWLYSKCDKFKDLDLEDSDIDHIKIFNDVEKELYVNEFLILLHFNEITKRRAVVEVGKFW